MNAELFKSTPINNTNTDIAIIGGGISSICLIHQLIRQQPELSITLFCINDEVASRGSSNQQGAIYPLLQGGQFSVLSELYAQCYPYAVDFYKQINGLGVRYAHQWCGVLQQAFNYELDGRLQSIASQWPELAQYISAKQSSQYANIDLPFPSLLFKQAGWISPVEFCKNSTEYFNKNFNVTIKTKSNITKLQQNPDQTWQLFTENTLLTNKYQHIVVCSGHLANQYEQTKQYDIIPIRGQVSHLHSESSASTLTSVVCHKGYITPVNNQLQCFGATFDRDNQSEISQPGDNLKNLTQLQNIYQQQSWANQLAQQDITNENAAIRATSQDHHPIVGEVMSDNWVKTNVDKNNGKLKRLDKLQRTAYPNSDNYGLYIMTGLGARGLTTAPLMAKHLSSLILNTQSPLPQRSIKSISPMRFQVRQLKKNKKIIS